MLKLTTGRFVFSPRTYNRIPKVKVARTIAGL